MKKGRDSSEEEMDDTQTDQQLKWQTAFPCVYFLNNFSYLL